MLALFVLGCVFGDVKALKAEVEALKDEVDELEEELDEQSQVDTGEPVDTGDSGGGDSEEPFEVPTARMSVESTGSSGNYVYTYVLDITGDYDKRRVSAVIGGDTMDEPTDDCTEWQTTIYYSNILVEFWYDGAYECWSSQAITSYPNCYQIAFDIADLSCD